MFNMERKIEMDRARALAGSTTGGHQETPEMTALINRYINEEIDAEELATLGKDLAMKEALEAVAKENK